MRKWAWVIVTFVVILIVGGYAFSRHQSIEKQYHLEMENAAAAIKDKNYTAAENYFQSALTRRNSDPTATHRLKQTKTFVNGMDQLENHHFSASKRTFQQVYTIHNGSEVLNDRAHQQIKEIEVVQKNVTKYNKTLDYARELNQAQSFELSNEQLDILFNTKEFKKGYYTSIWKAARALQKSNKTGLAQTVIPDVADNRSSSQSNAAASESSTNGTSQAAGNGSVSSLPKPNLSSSEQQAANNYSGSNEFTVTKKDTELNGKVISQDQITKARQELGNRAGQFSDQDVRNLIKEAGQKGISVTDAANNQ